MQYQKYRDTTLMELDEVNICPNLAWKHEADFVIVWWWFSWLHAVLELLNQNPGKKIILLEKWLCWSGMSGRSGGFLTPDSELGIRQIEDIYGSKLAEKIRSFSESWQQNIVHNIQNHKLNADLIQQDSMVLAYGKWWISDVAEEHEVRKSHNLNSELLNQSQTHIHNTGKKYKWSVLYSGCYNINPMKYCQEIKKYLISQWVYIYENTIVNDIEQNNIYTNTWQVRFDKMILAAGKIWHNLDPEKSKNTFGIHNFVAISEILTDAQLHEIMPNGKTMCRDTQLVFNYYRITSDNRILLGGGNPISSFWPWDHFDKLWILPVIKDIKKNFPILKDILFPYYRSGRIQSTKDLMPIIDFDMKYPNHVYIQWAVGLPRAASSGKFAADLINSTEDKELHTVLKADRSFKIPFSSDSDLIKAVIFGISNARAMGIF